MSLGILTFYRNRDDQSVTSSTTLVPSTDLQFPVAANTVYHLAGWIPFSEAAGTAGVKFQLTVPGGGAATFRLGFFIYNLVAGHIAIDNAGEQSGSASFTGTLANGGSNLMTFEADIVVGTTAGNIILEFAQAVSDAGATTLLSGALLSVLQLK